MWAVTYTITVIIYPLVVIPVVAFRTIIPQVRSMISQVFVPVEINKVVMVKSVDSRAIQNGVNAEGTLNVVAYKQVICRRACNLKQFNGSLNSVSKKQIAIRVLYPQSKWFHFSHVERKMSEKEVPKDNTEQTTTPLKHQEKKQVKRYSGEKNRKVTPKLNESQTGPRRSRGKKQRRQFKLAPNRG
jgi:hypothetical protein